MVWPCGLSLAFADLGKKTLLKVAVAPKDDRVTCFEAPRDPLNEDEGGKAEPSGLLVGEDACPFDEVEEDLLLLTSLKMFIFLLPLLSAQNGGGAGMVFLLVFSRY